MLYSKKFAKSRILKMGSKYGLPLIFLEKCNDIMACSIFSLSHDILTPLGTYLGFFLGMLEQKERGKKLFPEHSTWHKNANSII